MSQFGGMQLDEKMNELITNWAQNFLKEEDGKNYYKIADQILYSKVIEHFSTTLKISEKNVTADQFQEILKEISSVPKAGITLSSDNYGKQLYDAQVKKLELITNKLLEKKNLKQVTLGNAKQIDNNLLYKLIERTRPKKYSNALYTGVTKQYIELLNNASNFREPQFFSSQLTAQNYKYMLLYIGENIYEQQYYSGITHIYANFFEVNDIKVDEQNIHDYRELARIYAGWVKSESVKTPNTFVPTNQKFIDYLTVNIFNPNDSRLRIFLDSLIGKFPDLGDEKKSNVVTIYNSYNEAKTLKLDTEGGDSYILQSFIPFLKDRLKENYPQTIEFETNILTPAEVVNETIELYVELGYRVAQRGVGEQNTILAIDI